VRIAHVIVGLGQGGAEAVLRRLVTSARAGDRHVVISLMDDGVHGVALRSAGVEVVVLGMPRGRLTVNGLARLHQSLRAISPDIVQTWMYHADVVGGVVARFAGCRHVVWGIRHSNFDHRKTSRTTRWVVKAGALLSRVVPSAIACNSERAVRVHREIGYAGDKFRVIANGFDLSRFGPDDAARRRLRAEWGLGADTFLVGFVARWHPQKDHRNLLQAIEKARSVQPAIHCVLVGQEMTRDNAALVSLIDNLGLSPNIMLLGPRDDVDSVMKALDLHVMSSAYGEAFPNVVAEAMASGVPCVVTDVGDAALIVGDSGWVVAPGDAAALAQAIMSAMRERHDRPDQWRARQTAARARIAENFSMERMASAYRALWADVLRPAGGGPDGRDEGVR
jgi:glycosyltransferase involved in cell wall biosynthesis